MKFDKDKWKEKDDFVYIYRERMINDLIENHLNSRMTKNDVIDILGRSNYTQVKPLELVYEVYEDYGWDIDPIETHNLAITFNGDSTLEKAYLEIWKPSEEPKRKYFIVK
jgi:hypothetical protein